MQLVPISPDTKINIVASAVRNVCNAALSLLFTVALFIWGFLVNRKQAWRTDGGTMAFGCGALALAVVSTALNFLFVNKEDEFVWLPGLMWAVVLWQSFLGWWWWVGAGSGSFSHGGLSGDAEEDMEERLRKRERRRKQAQQRRKEQKGKAKNVWKGVSGVFSPARQNNTDDDDEGLRPRRARPVRRRSATPDRDGDEHDPSPPSPTLSVTSAISFTTLPRSLPRFIHEWYAFIRREHNAAARRQAAERVERIRELERNGQRRVPRSGSGWGLGSFGWRIAPAPGSGDIRTRRSFSVASRKDREEEGIEMQDASVAGPSSLKRQRSVSSSGDEDNGIHGPPREHELPLPAIHSRPSAISMRSGEVEDITPEVDSRSGTARRDLRITIPESPPPRALRAPAAVRTSAPPVRPTNSIWWRGPLSRWRLRDSTTYS